MDDNSNVRNSNNPPLPFDIIVNIIAKSPVKSIIACKLLSKPFNNLISSPSFSHHIYITNKSNSFTTICADYSKPDYSLYLVEFDQTDVYYKKDVLEISKHQVFNTGMLGDCIFFSIWGYCNGLFCFMKLKSNLYNLYVINPILGQFIQLPEPTVDHSPSHIRTMFFSYGIGYCQLSNRYKVIRIMTVYLGGSSCKSDAEIFTIGVDQTWRSLEDVNVPYNLKWGIYNPNPQTVKVPYRSALHWFVQPVPLNYPVAVEPNWGGVRMCICAFDITEENVVAIQIPPEVAQVRFIGLLTVLFDKLSLWLFRNLQFLDLWVMDDYGVEASWTKKFILQTWTLPRGIVFYSTILLTVSPQGVIVLSDYRKLVFYDMEKEKCLKVIHQSDHITYPIPFVPCFVPLKNLIQGPGLIIDVQPCSQVSKALQGWTRMAKALKTRCSAILDYLTPAHRMEPDYQGVENLNEQGLED